MLLICTVTRLPLDGALRATVLLFVVRVNSELMTQHPRSSSDDELTHCLMERAETLEYFSLLTTYHTIVSLCDEETVDSISFSLYLARK